MHIFSHLFNSLLSRQNNKEILVYNLPDFSWASWIEQIEEYKDTRWNNFWFMKKKLNSSLQNNFSDCFVSSSVYTAMFNFVLLFCQPVLYTGIEVTLPFGWKGQFPPVYCFGNGQTWNQTMCIYLHFNKCIKSILFIY